jgi:integrase
MARHVRATTLENRTKRLKLDPRRKPYSFTVIAPGIAVGYRRNKGPGTWVLRAANGHGAYWTDAIGLADDHEPADGSAVLTFWEAQDKARVLVRGGDAEGDRPATVADALDAYERDLVTRGGAVANARSVRKLLPAALLAKPVGLLIFRELRHWRDGLLDPRKASTVNRTLKCLKAGFNLAAAHDPRIGNAAVWRSALASLPDAHTARHVGLPERDVRAIVSAAYAVTPWLGLWTEVAATTGARPSQIARLDIADLQDDRDDPRLMMPSSKKGRGRKRTERRPVPIPPGLAAKLRAAAGKRPAGAPLLTQADGTRWRVNDHGRPFAQAAARAGLQGATAYALRHSSIIRALLAGVPVRVVAASHDTSVSMLERTYSAYILDHSDAVSRRALLDLAAESQS